MPLPMRSLDVRAEGTNAGNSPVERPHSAQLRRRTWANNIHPLPCSPRSIHLAPPLKESCREAVAQAKIAHDNGAFGVGAVLRHRGKILYSTPNRVLQSDWTRAGLGAQHTLHAEMGLLDWYGSKLQKQEPLPPLSEMEVITSLAPCLMCLGRLMKNNVRRVRYLADDAAAGITQQDAHQRLPKGLANAFVTKISTIDEFPNLKDQASTLFNQTCEAVKAKANQTVTNASTASTSHNQEQAALVTADGALTNFAKTEIGKLMDAWQSSSHDRDRAAILGPGAVFRLEVEAFSADDNDTGNGITDKRSSDDNTLRQLVLAWDATPVHQRPPLGDCVFISNKSLDWEKSDHTQCWDALHSVGVLGSTAEGQPLSIVMPEPLTEQAQAQWRALPPIYHPLRPTSCQEAPPSPVKNA